MINIKDNDLLKGLRHLLSGKGDQEPSVRQVMLNPYM